MYPHGQGVPENIEEFNLDERQRISEYESIKTNLNFFHRLILWKY